MGLPYRVIPVNIGRGEQFHPEFLAISPNNRIPAILDRDPADGGEAVSVFESGAILLYLAEKAGRFLPSDLRGRYRVTQWVMWQMAGLGPMAGQNHHFAAYAPEKLDYAIQRYRNETNRLYGVLDGQLRGRDYICGELSIADMACWPWIVPHERQGQNLEDFPDLKSWFERMKQRPAVARGFQLGQEVRSGEMDEKARQILFGQRARRA